ncbi:MAG: class I SAM-dependent methyltransferase, partial [Gammaproteobacteria bacterium]|nr:class I SAM-dependent methyltransferase [Gammaproteobacteria bacterium]
SAEELSIDNIEFHCGDILGLGDLGRTFHIIESVGVLHHMADPEQGLSILRSLLAPHGLMNLGLYSSLARRVVHAARDHFKVEAGLPNLDGIRRARSEILSLPHDHPMHKVTGILDFYSLSDCRDLLFHTQESCYTLPEIATLLERNRLKFVGFDYLDPHIKARYREQFPDDPSMTDLMQWDRIEQDYPDAFIGMYVFWCQAID